MRRPVSVKSVFLFPPYLPFLCSSRAASVAILPSALFFERFSLRASWTFSFQQVLLPSMRRPVRVKTVFLLPPYKSFLCSSRAASVAILPSALFFERFSLRASWAFSFQQVLLPDNRPR